MYHLDLLVTRPNSYGTWPGLSPIGDGQPTPTVRQDPAGFSDLLGSQPFTIPVVSGGRPGSSKSSEHSHMLLPASDKLALTKKKKNTVPDHQL